MDNNQKQATIIVALKQILSTYQKGGYKVVDVRQTTNLNVSEERCQNWEHV